MLQVAALGLDAGTAVASEEADDDGGVPIDLALLLGLIATGLLCGEWVAYRAGRML